MKKILYVIVAMLCIVDGAMIAATKQRIVSPTFAPRSQSCYRVRQLVGDGWNGVERLGLQTQSVMIEDEHENTGWGWNRTGAIFAQANRGPKKNKSIVTEDAGIIVEPHTWYGSLSIMPEYAHSFNSEALSKGLFGSDICDGTVLVQGSNVDNRTSTAWLADYLYLSPDFDGKFHIKPVIQNFLVDFDFYLGMDKIAHGLYLRLYGPFVWTKWSTNFCDSKTTNTSLGGYDVGYFTPEVLPQSALNTSIRSYMRGDAPSEVDDVYFYGLEFSKIRCDGESKIGFADLRMELGWNFIHDDYHHLAISVQGACPTGNMRKTDYIFEPVVGNGNHWELGGGFNMHYTFWRNELRERYAYLYIDLSITHIFPGYEQRTFDICDSPNSRYMLAERITTPVEDGLSAAPDSAATTVAGTPPSSQFKKIYSPVANLTTAQPSVSNAVQADFVAFMDFTVRNWKFDLGYNLWVRTCDRIANARKCSTALSIFNEINERVWALKGDAHMFGYATATDATVTQNQAIPLSATESIATIHNGTNALVAVTNRALNEGVDTPEYAYAGSTSQRLTYAPSLANTSDNHVKTSNAPEFINYININQQQTSGLSHSVFAHVNYTWQEKWHTIQPFFGGGLVLEFGKNSARYTMPQLAETGFIDVCDDACIDYSLSQWGVWIKGGFIFG